MAYPRTVEVDFDRRKAVPGKGQEYLSKTGIWYEDDAKEKWRTSNHGDWITDFECSFKHEVWHVAMYALQSSK